MTEITEIKETVYFSPETLIFDMDADNYDSIFLEKIGVELSVNVEEWGYEFIGVNDENLLEFEVWAAIIEDTEGEE